MKTTVDISDPLLREARELAEKEGTTLRALVEDGLRRALADRRGRKKLYRLRDASVPGGEGLAPGLEGNWAKMRALIYEGRGE